MSLKELNFSNVREDYPLTTSQENNPTFKVYDDNNDLLSEANCKRMTIKKFVFNWFYDVILKSEINYCFLEVFDDEDRALTNNLDLEDYVKYMSNNYEDESIRLEGLYKMYVKLEQLLSEDSSLIERECIFIDYIYAQSGFGAGTLIVDYLKNKYDFIFIYGEEYAESYWEDKVSFKEMFNGYMYWTNHKKLDDILSSIN